MSMLRRCAIALVFSAIGVTSSAPARAAFTEEQTAELARGELVTETAEYDAGSHHFVGGVSYQIVNAPALRLSLIARDVTRYSELLPNVIDAQLVEVLPSGTGKVRVTHKMGFVRGGYTMKIGFSEAGMLGHFYLDKSADNALDDGWGFVRFTPLGDGARTLVTYGVLFDLGGGLIRALFESRIQLAALSYPRRLADAAAH